MLELPDLTPEHFEILVMRELRKVGLEISELRIHRRTMLPEPDEGYLLEVKGVVRGAGWERRVLIACRRQQRPIVAAEVELLKDHVKEADAEGGLLFGAADFEPDALTTAEDTALALLRVTDGRTAFRSEEHTSELQSHSELVCRLLLEKKKESRRHNA